MPQRLEVMEVCCDDIAVNLFPNGDGGVSAKYSIFDHFWTRTKGSSHSLTHLDYCTHILIPIDRPLLPFCSALQFCSKKLAQGLTYPRRPSSSQARPGAIHDMSKTNA